MPREVRKTGGLIRSTGRLVRRIVGALLVVVGFAWVVSLLSVIGFAAYDGAKPADAIVVLGAAQYDGKPSPVLRARLDHAIELWRDSTAQLLIFTGGMGSGDTTSEAAVSSVYARRRGVPEGVILLETEGRTSRASMKAVASMLHVRGMTSVVLVSDPFHMFRLWVLAQRMGLQAHPSPTRTSPISMRSVKNAGYILSESFKAPIAFIIG
jgi:uncharacterized SAM-binding protein YcdF (DUF218 family)